MSADGRVVARRNARARRFSAEFNRRIARNRVFLFPFRVKKHDGAIKADTPLCDDTADRGRMGRGKEGERGGGAGRGRKAKEEEGGGEKNDII